MGSLRLGIKMKKNLKLIYEPNFPKKAKGLKASTKVRAG
jgi:hypothetical protein